MKNKALLFIIKTLLSFVEKDTMSNFLKSAYVFILCKNMESKIHVSIMVSNCNTGSVFFHYDGKCESFSSYNELVNRVEFLKKEGIIK